MAIDHFSFTVTLWKSLALFPCHPSVRSGRDQSGILLAFSLPGYVRFWYLVLNNNVIIKSSTFTLFLCCVCLRLLPLWESKTVYQHSAFASYLFVRLIYTQSYDINLENNAVSHSQSPPEKPKCHQPLWSPPTEQHAVLYPPADRILPSEHWLIMK